MDTQRTIGWRRGLALVVVSAALVTCVGAQGARATAGETICHERSVRVSRVALVPAALLPATINGTLCVPPGATVVQLLVHGATYNRSYWDFGLEPETYSYVRAANARGFATFAVDVVGTGSSSHPLSVEVNYVNAVAQLHQVVQWLRGADGGPGFPRVAWVGHSMGSIYALLEASLYRDLDAVVLTGYAHHPRPDFAIDSLFKVAPVGRGLDPGYQTTKPGARSIFYNVAATDPAVLAHDDATKDAVTATQFATTLVASSTPVSRGIGVPVLLAIGEFDNIYCQSPGTSDAAASLGIPCGRPGAVVAVEGPYFAAAACMRVQVIPSAGHSFNLHRNAPDAFDRILDWAEAVLPAAGGHRCSPA